jgi:hypothetical protein
MNNIDVKKFLKRIHDDSSFYAENYLKIRTKDGQLVNFAYNPMQKKSKQIIDRLRHEGKPVRVIWLKARQHGISTFCEAEIFHDTVNNPFRNSLIIAHEDKATQNLFSMSKLYYEELPPALRPMKKYSNESALVFENPTNDENEKYKNPGLRSKITVATAKNVQTARSNTVHNLHASEVAFWEDAETLMTGLLQCIPDVPNSMIFIESTANGIGGWFYDFWQKSVRGETDYVPVFLAWFENPEYSRPFSSKAEKQFFVDSITKSGIDENGREVLSEELVLRQSFNVSWEQLHWRKWCIANKLNGDIEKFHQEYPSTPDEAFIASGRPQFSVVSLKKYQQQQKPPLRQGYLQIVDKKLTFIDDPKGYIRIWKQPDPEKFYVIGGDVAEGLATGDYSAGIVMSEDFDVCASWHGHVDPDIFGEELVHLAQFYNDAYIGVESNKDGGSTLRTIIRKEYWNLYYQKTYNKVSESVSQKVGWNTNVRTKPLMINALTEYIRETWIGMWWDTLISECFTYVKGEDGSTNAQSGSHDDTVMALAIALQLLLEGKGENYTPEIPCDQQKKYAWDGDDEEFPEREELCLDFSEQEEYAD